MRHVATKIRQRKQHNHTTNWYAKKTVVSVRVEFLHLCTKTKMYSSAAVTVDSGRVVSSVAAAPRHAV